MLERRRAALEWVPVKRHAATLTAAGAVALASVSCPAGRTEGPSILLITIDTLRADRLGCYGRSGAKTPAADRLAREGARFATVVTPVPRTTPAVASLLTGLWPASHRVRGLWSKLPGDVPTLASWLRARGLRTAAFASNLFLRPGSGFERGFEVYSNPRNRWEGDSASEVTGEALDWLSRLGSGERFFLWVHYLDPHWTYDPPPPFDTLYDPAWTGSWPYSKLTAGGREQGRIIFQNPMTPREVDHAVALYDGEIGAADREAGRLLDALSASGRLDSTLVVYTSDHGESLGEHGYAFAHGEYLYDGTLLVPLLLRWPGRVPAGRVISRMARLIDVAPTVLALAGEPLLPGLDGRSLTRDLAGEPDPAERECWVESDHDFIHPENPRHFVPGFDGKWRGLRGERYKLIFAPRDAAGDRGDVELYDIAADPAEAHDLSRERPEVAGDLLRRLRVWWETAGAVSDSQNGVPSQEAETLRSLGYL